MGLFDSILGGLKEVANSEIQKKVNDAVSDIKGKVTEQIDTHVDAQMNNMKDKVTNAGIEIAMKKFLLNMQKSYQEYGYDVKIDIDGDGKLSDEELNNAVNILNNFIESNKENVRNSMVSKGYTVEEADSLLTKEQEILKDMDKVRVYGKAHDEEKKELAIKKLNTDMTEFSNIAVEFYNRHPELKANNN